MKAPLIFAATTLLAMTFAAPADARSTPSEMRGYEACLSANADDFRGLVPDRTYLLDERDGKRTYYINATAWQNGERVEVGFRCETNRSGRLLSVSRPEFTRYVPAESSVQVASQ